MAVHILGQTDVAKYEYLRVWAERGLIHMEDSRDNSFETISVTEALIRARALNDMRPGLDGTESKAERHAVYEQREKIQLFVEHLLTIVRKAQEQGMPDDPSARQSLKAKRPKSILIPRNVFTSTESRRPLEVGRVAAPKVRRD